MTTLLEKLEKIHKPMRGEAYPDDPRWYCVVCTNNNGGSSHHPCKTLKVARAELQDARAAASTRSLAGVPDAGGAVADGWRLLEVGEVVKAGDEVFNAYGTWSKTTAAVGETVTEEDKRGQFVVRRRMSAQRAAPPPAPAAENGE